jgi:hypothetical protein
MPFNINLDVGEGNESRKDSTTKKTNNGNRRKPGNNTP